MGDTHFRVSEGNHEKMKQIYTKKGYGSIREVYDEAIENYIKQNVQDEILKDSEIEIILNERITKLDKHLASMLARTGMDTSMVLMGIITLLEKLLNVDRKDIIFQLRKDGAKYFSNAIKEDKENKSKDK